MHRELTAPRAHDRRAVGPLASSSSSASACASAIGTTRRARSRCSTQGLAPTGDHRRLSALARALVPPRRRERRPRATTCRPPPTPTRCSSPGPARRRSIPSDPRVRLAYDLYNRGLTEALPARPRRRGDPARSGTYELPIGSARGLGSRRTRSTGRATACTASSPRRTTTCDGLRNRYRRPGIGAPLSARARGPGATDAVPAERFLPGMRVPATASSALRQTPPRAPRADSCARRSRSTRPTKRLTVEIDGREVPVEFETSSSLAATPRRVAALGLRARAASSRAPSARSQKAVTRPPSSASSPWRRRTRTRGCCSCRPTAAGASRVVLVHGTASSPARWADLVNELENDRAIFDALPGLAVPLQHRQPDRLLRRPAAPRARARRRALDPEGTDAALRRMVVIGHSQGGLLTKLTAVDSGIRFWDQLANAPLDELDLVRRRARDAAHRARSSRPSRS